MLFAYNFGDRTLYTSPPWKTLEGRGHDEPAPHIGTFTFLSEAFQWLYSIWTPRPWFSLRVGYLPWLKST
jgi:hypothetical protein